MKTVPRFGPQAVVSQPRVKLKLADTAFVVAGTKNFCSLTWNHSINASPELSVPSRLVSPHLPSEGQCSPSAHAARGNLGVVLLAPLPSTTHVQRGILSSLTSSEPLFPSTQSHHLIHDLLSPGLLQASWLIFLLLSFILCNPSSIGPLLYIFQNNFDHIISLFKQS